MRIWKVTFFTLSLQVAPSEMVGKWIFTIDLKKARSTQNSLDFKILKIFKFKTRKLDSLTQYRTPNLIIPRFLHNSIHDRDFIPFYVYKVGLYSLFLSVRKTFHLTYLRRGKNNPSKLLEKIKTQSQLLREKIVDNVRVFKRQTRQRCFRVKPSNEMGVFFLFLILSQQFHRTLESLHFTNSI